VGYAYQLRQASPDQDKLYFRWYFIAKRHVVICACRICPLANRFMDGHTLDLFPPECDDAPAMSQLIIVQSNCQFILLESPDYVRTDLYEHILQSASALHNLQVCLPPAIDRCRELGGGFSSSVIAVKWVMHTSC
jgi:hypothetical protein